MLRLYAHIRLSDGFVAYLRTYREIGDDSRERMAFERDEKNNTIFNLLTQHTSVGGEIYEDGYVSMGTGRYNVWAVVVESYAFASGECISVASFLNAPGSGWPSVTMMIVVSILVELM